MTDEKFTFQQDVREKKITARSARRKRTHTGKGGRVTFPSDFMTKKEIEKMNGEVKCYRLNDPMTWAEFTKMPDDIRITYIKLIREKFGTPDQHIGRMLGVCQKTFSTEAIRLGVAAGKGSFKKKWDKDGFYAWCSGAEFPAPAAEAEENGETTETAPVCVENECEETPVSQGNQEPFPVVPECGKLVFECRASQALAVLEKILGDEYIRLSIAWDKAFDPMEGSVRCGD